MKSISVFLDLDIAHFDDFRGKIADVNRTQRLYHIIHTTFGSSLGKVSFIILGYV